MVQHGTNITAQKMGVTLPEAVWLFQNLQSTIRLFCFTCRTETEFSFKHCLTATCDGCCVTAHNFWSCLSLLFHNSVKLGVYSFLSIQLKLDWTVDYSRIHQILKEFLLSVLISSVRKGYHYLSTVLCLHIMQDQDYIFHAFTIVIVK